MSARPSADLATRLADGIPGVHHDGGPAFDVRTDPAGYLRACAERYGDVFALTRDHVQVWDPVMAREILRRDGDFVLAPPPVHTSRRSIQVDDPDRWRVARRYAWTHLSPRTLEPRRERVTRRWMRELDGAGGRLADTAQVVSLTARVIWPELLADTSEDPALFESFAVTSRLRQRQQGARWPWRRRALRRRFDDAIGRLLAVVARRRAEGVAARGDLLDALLAGDDPPLTDVEVAQTLSVCLDSSMQTTGSGASWVLSALASQPGRASALAEIEDAERLVREVLRHTPVMAALNRRTQTDVTMHGCPVGAGADVLLAVEGMHRDPRRWRRDPERFDPSRWEDDVVHDVGAHLTWGAGPRMCLGLHLATLALTELARVVARNWVVDARPSRLAERDSLNWPTGFPVVMRRVDG
ncbi:MAG: cytochrome P450 [Phycicoccus sp.]